MTKSSGNAGPKAVGMQDQKQWECRTKSSGNARPKAVGMQDQKQWECKTKSRENAGPPAEGNRVNNRERTTKNILDMDWPTADEESARC